jgi:sporulation protein YlmC with PRC-barrel domain
LEGEVDLVRDISDKQVLDRDGREIGRVDRVILALEPDGLRVVAIEIGPAVLASRLSSIAGRWVAGLERALGFDHGRPLRIPVADVISAAPHIRVTWSFGDTPAAIVEAAVRSWLPRLPGAS